MVAGVALGLLLADDKQPAVAPSTRTLTRTTLREEPKPLRLEDFVYSGTSEPSAFAPPDTTFRLGRMSWRPPRIFVAWTRTDDPRNRKDRARPYTAGVVIWRRERYLDGHRWRRVYERRYRPFAYIGMEFGDVTHDGVADVLHQDEQGSGGCGPHYLVATVRGREREIFRRESCETQYRIVRGVLIVNLPVGPCPRPQAAHCSGGRRVERMRWSGRRLATVHTRTTCFFRWLDPRSGCKRRPG